MIKWGNVMTTFLVGLWSVFVLFCFVLCVCGRVLHLRYGYQGQFVVTNKLIKLFYVMLFLKMLFEAVYTVVS